MTHVDLSDVQGNILRGYHLKFVRHVVVRVADRTAARKFLAAVVPLLSNPGRPADAAPPRLSITTAEWWTSKPATCLNVAITASGLSALGVSASALNSFPSEFRAGATARGPKVGDVDESAPHRWRYGMDDPEKVHLMWTIHGETADERDAVDAELELAWRRSGAFTVTAKLDGAFLPDDLERDGFERGEPDGLGDKVHFGYRDSIAQPRFVVNGEPIGKADAQPLAPVGAVLLGPDYKTTFPNVTWRKLADPYGLNGCFNAFRVLEQDVHSFETFLDDSAAQTGWDRELVAAKLMGRWRNGAPLTPSLLESRDFKDIRMPRVDEETINFFDYPNEAVELDDFEGLFCPVGSHIRRANPRSARIAQRSANYTRPMVRRGVPYGPPMNPGEPDDGQPRGLLGSFLCASIIAQFEAVMYDWINLGLLDPSITGTNDPILGANRPSTSRFVIPVGNGQPPVVLSGFPRFIQTVGAAYLFCPSVAALRHLGELSS
ncbi:MAG: deferrochelatase/peroxidase EfeB [Acidimicrobiales bacterium]|jgi:deferrochelatase/peroxidase EfeB